VTLVWLAAAFIVGIFTGAVVDAPSAPLFGVGAVVTVAVIVVWRRPRLRMPLLLAAVFLLGAGRAETARIHIGPGDVAYYNGRTVTLTGYVNTEPDARDTGINYVLTIDHMIQGTHQQVLHGQLELHTAPGQVLSEGDEVQLTGLLATPTNSPQIPYRSILANRGIYSEMSFPKLFVTGQVNLGLIGVAAQIRQWIENSIAASLPEPEATFLIAILIALRPAR